MSRREGAIIADLVTDDIKERLKDAPLALFLNSPPADVLELLLKNIRVPIWKVDTTFTVTDTPSGSWDQAGRAWPLVADWEYGGDS